jgi:hypothetical protein
VLALVILALADSAAADTLRIATWNTELQRRSPGLLLHDIEAGKDPQLLAAVAVITEVAPDILLLASFDYDFDLLALSAFADRLAEAGAAYPHRFAFRPNTGRATGLDLDGDGRLGGPGDAQGFGYFAGQGGMAILSRYPLAEDRVADYSGFLWRDLPGALLPEAGGAPFPSADAQAVQMLPTTGHWAVPVMLPSGVDLTLLAWHASPPVFDGPEDRNGRRNHDEAAFWTALMGGRLPFAAPEPPFVLLGDANLDPVDGDGLGAAMQGLLADPRLQDPAPESLGGIEAAGVQGGPNARHQGPAARDTADWAEAPGPGNLRVDYVLPSAGLTIAGSGVFWPEAADPMAAVVAEASRHRIVWVDIEMPR